MSPFDQSNTHHPWPRIWPQLILAFAAFLAVLPLWLHSYSCGHDFDFHLRSWLEAATAWRGGILRPVWAFHPAWNVGEPRLLFYPPLSWMTGGMLTLLLPWSVVFVAFTWLVLYLSGATMHRLLRRWISPAGATLGGCLYLANPYMLFCAYERTAYAELMAAAWAPLLLAALLRSRPSPWRIAVAVALLWLTNAPAAIVGSYSTVLIAAGVLLMQLYQQRQSADRKADAFARTLRMAWAVFAGVIGGLLLDGFYVIPLLWERRYVQLNLAVVPMARPDANFLFVVLNDWFHDQVLRQASWIGVGLVAAAVLAGGAWLLLNRRRTVVHSYASMHDLQASETRSALPLAMSLPVLMGYSVIVLFLLSHWSRLVWHVAPQLVFLQFPWRFLAMQGAVTVAVVAVFLDRIAPRKYAHVWMPAIGIVFVAAVAFFGADKHFREECDKDEGIYTQLHAYQTGESFEEPTDEYTATDSDNDVTDINLAPAWMGASATYTPPGNGELPSGVSPIPEHDLRLDDRVFNANATAPAQFLLVRIRNFPGWHVLVDGKQLPALPHRADGLIAVPLVTAGPHRVEVRYRKTPDQWIGGGVSVVALAGLLFFNRRRRTVTT